MSQSLKARFNGNSQEVVKYAKTFGVSQAMRYYEVKDYLAMHRFLEEQAPDEHFNYTEVETSNFSQPDAFDKLLESMLHKYSGLEAKIATLDSENAELKRQILYYRARRWSEAAPVVQSVLTYCQK